MRRTKHVLGWCGVGWDVVGWTGCNEVGSVGWGFAAGSGLLLTLAMGAALSRGSAGWAHVSLRVLLIRNQWISLEREDVG